MLLNFKIILAFLLFTHVSTKLPRRRSHKKQKFRENKSHLRVLSGKDSPLGELPYIVRMEIHWMKLLTGKNLEKIEILQPNHVCTCAQVAPTWSLTAAHCAVGMREYLDSFKDITNVSGRGVIRYGAVEDVFNHTSDILKFIIHHSYTKEPVLTNDIALAKTNIIRMRIYGRISAVDYTTMIGLKAKIVGFGLMNMTINSKDIIESTDLFLKPLQVMDVLIKKCDKILKNLIKLAICLAPPCKKETALCNGDSGGPLLQGDTIIGVNSLGPISDCDGRRNGERYSYLVGSVTPVSPFLDWIAHHIDLVPNY